MINIHETSDIHGRNTRYSSDFHYPTSNLAIYHHYMGLKVFNSLPPHIKDKLQNIKVFKQLIRNFLDCNTFYTMDKYFNYNKKKILGRFWPYPTLCLSQNSYASVCIIIIFIVQLFLCVLLHSYFIVYDVDVYGHKPLAMLIEEIVCIGLIPYPMMLWLYPLRIAGLWNK